MEHMQHNQSQQQGVQNHTWVFTLLLCAVMLLMGVFGFAIFSIYNANTGETEVPAEIQPEDQETPGTSADSEEQPADTETNDQQNQPGNRSTHTGQYPTFTAPTDWNVVVQTGSSADYYITNTMVSNEDIRICTDCGNYTIPLTITHYQAGFADAPTFDGMKRDFNDHLTGLPAADVTSSTEILSNGTLYSVSGTTPEAAFGPHYEELLLFIGDDGTTVYFRFADFEGNAALVAEWERIKSSLRF